MSDVQHVLDLKELLHEAVKHGWFSPPEWNQLRGHFSTGRLFPSKSPLGMAMALLSFANVVSSDHPRNILNKHFLKGTKLETFCSPLYENIAMIPVQMHVDASQTKHKYNKKRIEQSPFLY